MKNNIKPAAKLALPSYPLRNLIGFRASPSSGAYQEAQARRLTFLSLLTSFGLSAIISGIFFSDSAYAAYSASISRTSSGTITLSDSSGGSIKPSSSGTLGTGSDVVTVSSNCSAGYNLYVSAISGGSTSLSTSGGLDYIPSTTTATDSETALPKDTWGIGKDGTTFSKLQSYSEDLSTMSPLYTGTGSISSPNKEYTIYYGVNVSTAKTPGTYTGDVLYTVVMNSACEKFTLNFDGNGATTNNLPSEELAFDATIDLSIISSTDKIAKTGYHLTGWQDQDGNSYGITGEVDINPNDLTTVTLTAIWTANTYTIKYAAGSTGGSCSISDTSATYDQDVTLSSTKCTKTNYDQKGWSINQDGSTKDYTLGQTLEKPNFTTGNNDPYLLYPYFESSFSSTTMQGWNSCNTLSTNGSVSLSDARDGTTYTIKRFTSTGKCYMTENLTLGKDKGYTLTPTDTNIDNNTTYYIPASGYQGNITDPNTVDSTTAVSFSASNDNQARVQYVAAGTTGIYSYGPLAQNTVYYNYYTGTLGFSYYNDGISSGSSTRDICPRGWQLPNGGTGSYSWNEMVTDLGSSYNNIVNIGGFVLSGTMREVTTLWNTGANGFYLSSSIYSNDRPYTFAIGSDGKVYPQSESGTLGKYTGFAIRCVKK